MTSVEPYRPSNGTEGEFFQEAWCYRCARDTEARPCSILTRTMAFNIEENGYPKEWIRDVGPWPGNPRCTAFREPRARPRSSRVRDKRQISLIG